MSVTPIEWTDVTWNPVRGCARVSPGCEHCYAERTAHRFSGKGQPYEGLTVLGKHGPRWAGTARFVPEMLAAPLGWRTPRRVFVNSMSDLFHDDVTNEQIAAVFGVMAACPQHTFQVLTKRPERMLEWFGWLAEDCDGDPPGWTASSVCGCHAANYGANVDYHGLDAKWPLPNVWLGVSCEDQQRADERIPLLLATPAAVRFVSAEPLLGPLDLNRIHGGFDHENGAREDWWESALSGLRYNIYMEQEQPTAKLDWVIVGGESGPDARACEVGWIRSIVSQCQDATVPCFVKQLGAMQVHDLTGMTTEQRLACLRSRMSDRKGGIPSEWPADLRVREFPEVQS